MGILLKILKRLIVRRRKPAAWNQIEYFDPAWEKRIQQMSSFIPSGSSVMDLGCGQMNLKKYIPDSLYIPVDYRRRDDQTVICDFNKHEFPEQKADTIFVSGCLEYITDFTWFINSMCQAAHLIIISYCSTDYFRDLSQRHSNHWQNHLSHDDIISLFRKNRFQLSETALTPSKNSIFVFKKSE